MYAGIFVLAIALIVLVVWVSSVSSKMAALKQALMIEQRKIEELEQQLGIDNVRSGAVGRMHAGSVDRSSGFEAASNASTGEIGLDAEYIADSAEGAIVLSDAQAARQQEQIQRISRARERQAMLKKKHSDEISAELRRKREIARQREEQVRSFQRQQEELRRRMVQERAEMEAEEERLNKLRTRASWSGSSSSTSARPRTRVSSARLEERRQAQLRRKAEEIVRTRLGNAGETNNFGNSVDFR